LTSALRRDAKIVVGAFVAYVGLAG